MYASLELGTLVADQFEDGDNGIQLDAGIDLLQPKRAAGIHQLLSAATNKLDSI